MRRIGILAAGVLLSTGLAVGTAAVPAQASVTGHSYDQGHKKYSDDDEDNWYWGIFCLLSYCDF